MKSEAWGCVTVSKKASAAPYSLRQLWNYWALENNTQGCQVLEVLSMTRFGPEAPSSIVVKYVGYRPKCVSVLACVPLWRWAFLLFELYGRGTRGRPECVSGMAGQALRHNG